MRIVMLLLLLVVGSGAQGQPRYGYTVLGEPALPAGFSHFPYVNPDAPKGGEMTLATVGTFDNFNPLILRGTSDGHEGRPQEQPKAPPASPRGTRHAGSSSASSMISTGKEPSSG